MLSSWSATLSAKGLSSGTVQGITFPRTVRKFSSASYSHVIMFCTCLTVKFLFYQPQVKDALPPMPKKQFLAMLEGPPGKTSDEYIGSPYRTLPPIGSAPLSGRRSKSTTPRKLSTAPGLTETTPRDSVRPQYERTNSMPPEMPGSSQYRSDLSTRQTVKTDGQATVGESVGTADGRGQPRADRQINSEDGFFMTQVRLFNFLRFVPLAFLIFEVSALRMVGFFKHEFLAHNFSG